MNPEKGTGKPNGLSGAAEAKGVVTRSHLVSLLDKPFMFEKFIFISKPSALRFRDSRDWK